MKELKNMSISYQQLASYRNEKRIKYLLRKGISVNLNWEAKREEIYNVTKFNYLHLESLRKGLTPVFVTLTLPSEYHRFKLNKRGNKHILNPEYSGISIEKSYKKLLEIWRNLYNGFVLVEGGKAVKQKVLYSRVVEPHKDFTPHLHAVCYVRDPGAFKRHFDNVVFRHSLNQVDFVDLSKTQSGKKESKPEEKFYSIAYLLKYVSKTISGENLVIEGWRKAHKIVSVRTSNMPFNRVEFDLFVSNVPYNPKYKNYYYQMQEELLVHRHSVTVKSGLLKQFRDRELHFLSHVFDKMNYKQLGNLESPKYVINNVYVNTISESVVEVETYENDFITGFSTHCVYDDMFDLPMISDDGIPIFELELDYYYYENWYDYHAYNKKYSRVQLLLDFTSVEDDSKSPNFFSRCSDNECYIDEDYLESIDLF